MVERGSGVAVWRQIGESLAEDIRSRRYPPGEQLPTEPELAARYGVNRHTVRRAIGELEQHGVVRVEQGRGTFVQPHAIDYPIGRRTRFSANLRKHGLVGHVDFVDSDIVQDTDIAKHLKLSNRAKLLRVRIVGKSEDRALSVSDHYFENKRFPDFAVALQSAHSISKVYAQYGIDDYLRKWSRITATLPDADIAHLLNQSKLRPILQVEALNIDLNGVPLQYSLARFVGDGVQLVISDDD
ncbi:MAG: phosphonate metabolism transcriptional regulator PhnF [Janthinobacterium lividum]